MSNVFDVCLGLWMNAGLNGSIDGISRGSYPADTTTVSFRARGDADFRHEADSEKVDIEAARGLIAAWLDGEVFVPSTLNGKKKAVSSGLRFIQVYYKH